MVSEKKRLIVIDGNSLLYRAFFAMRYLSTSDGQPTNALYGLTTMLLRVLEEKPDYIAVAFDTHAPTFRHDEYPAYKAQRKPTPDALIRQSEPARDLVRAFSIPVIEAPGFEADDIIGALARQAAGQGVRTTIVTGDLDALQLVNDDVEVMTTVKGVSDTVVYDPESVRERFGLRADQMTDFKGLKGDSSDNIPGVPGIGDKTAAELLQRYDTLENVIEHIHELPEGRIRKTLEENRDQAVLSKRLATIVTELPELPELDQLRFREPDLDALRDLFVRLEFKTMLRRLPEVGKAEGSVSAGEKPALGTCRRIDSEGELKDLLDSIRRSGEVAVHIHTADGKSIEAGIIGLSLCAAPGGAAYVQVLDPENTNSSLELGFDRPYAAELASLAPVLESEEIVKCCHDLKLTTAALELRGIGLKAARFDTMLGAYLLDPTRGSFDIGDVAFEQLGLELPGVTQRGADADPDPVTLTCGMAEAIWRVSPVIQGRLERDDLMRLYREVEHPLAPILARMELAGVAIDTRQLGALSTRLDVDIRALERDIYESAGEEFNIGSPKQLQAVLFERLGLQAGKKTKTGYSTSASTLEMLANEHPVVDMVLRWRELTKIKSTYADALPKLINPKTGRVHTSLNQAVTATGRLSSSDPNLQNIPVRTELGREIRRAFIASEGCALLSADYSQIELRILAHVTGDEGLLRAFENDEDIHSATACTLFGCAADQVTPEMRRRAKTVNFAVIYGMGDFSLGRALGITTQEAREYIDTYFARFPGVREYTDRTIAAARERGWVCTPLGRRRYIQDINSSNRNTRLFAERAAVNMPIQGMAADIMKLAMIRADRELASSGCRARMLLQVHDELLFEAPVEELDDVAGLARRAMEGAYELRAPLRVDVKRGANWADME